MTMTYEPFTLARTLSIDTAHAGFSPGWYGYQEHQSKRVYSLAYSHVYKTPNEPSRDHASVNHVIVNDSKYVLT